MVLDGPVGHEVHPDATVLKLFLRRSNKLEGESMAGRSSLILFFRHNHNQGILTEGEGFSILKGADLI